MMNAPDGFAFLAKVSEIVDSKLVAEIDDVIVVVVEQNGEYFCLDDVCTHDGGILSDGEIEDGCLVCDRHGAKFDLKTGEAKCMPATEPTRRHEVKVVGDEIFVRLSSEVV